MARLLTTHIEGTEDRCVAFEAQCERGPLRATLRQRQHADYTAAARWWWTEARQRILAELFGKKKETLLHFDTDRPGRMACGNLGCNQDGCASPQCGEVLNLKIFQRSFGVNYARLGSAAVYITCSVAAGLSYSKAEDTHVYNANINQHLSKHATAVLVSLPEYTWFSTMAAAANFAYHHIPMSPNPLAPSR